MGEAGACRECGYHNNGGQHPLVQCTVTGRCGECGSDWPCPDHVFQHEPRRTAQLNFDKPKGLHANAYR